MNAETPPLAGLKDVELETEVLRASDRLEAVAEEYLRRGRPYPARRLLALCRQAEDIVNSESAWNKVHSKTV